MKTTKPQATISYNSVGFLLGVLDRLVSSEIITFYAVIRHEPEEDENKAHCHVYVEPAKTLDNLWLRKQFAEVDPSHPNQPLGCMPFGASKWVDWYWYGLHDKAYLASKGETRKYHYDRSEMLTSSVDYLDEKVRENPNPKAELIKLLELINKGYTPLQLAVALNVKARNLNYFLQGVSTLYQHRDDITERNGRNNHEISEFGEVDDE